MPRPSEPQRLQSFVMGGWTASPGHVLSVANNHCPVAKLRCQLAALSWEHGECSGRRDGCIDG